jgi:ligand-binding SRPBCC domain-containing protein
MMTSRVIELSRPRGYVEEQVKGDLKVYRHEHFFKPADNGTIMIDIIEYGGPRDLLGAVAGKRYLADYLEKFIQKKADLIREYAETDRWKVLLS